MLERKQYTSELTDAEWVKIEPLLPPDKPLGRGREVNLREVLNAIYYRADINAIAYLGLHYRNHRPNQRTRRVIFPAITSRIPHVLNLRFVEMR